MLKQYVEINNGEFMKNDHSIYNSRLWRISLLLSILVTILIVFIKDSYAWDKAIWPFNTPNMVSKQICKNSKSWAMAAYHCYDRQSRVDLMSELNDHRNISIKEDPKYKSWHIIYYNEMARYVRIVWKNPNVTEDMAIEIVENDCRARRKQIKKRLEDTNPKK